MNHEAMGQILRESSTIAVVGCSPKTSRDSNMVARYLLDAGYSVIPVRPGSDEILGQKAYAALKDLPNTPDIVDVFRNSDDALGVVEEALALDPQPKAIWLQFGVVNEAAAALCERAGVTLYMNHCIKVDHALACDEEA